MSSPRRDLFAAAAADGGVWIVADLAAGEVGHVRIEQGRQCPQDAAFRLSPQPEQNKIVAREDGIHDLWHHGVVVSNNAGKDAGIVVLTQPDDEIVPEFVFHAADAQTFFGKSTAAQFAERARKTHEEPPRQILFWIIRGFTTGRVWHSVHVPVASSFCPGTRGAMEVGNDSLKIGNK